MTDTEQTIDEQLEEKPESPGGSPPGAEKKPSSKAAANAAESPRAESASASPVDGHADRSASEIDCDPDELATVAAERDEYLALAQRTQADFENYRKRVARESALAQERGVAKLAKELLPALDNLDRALDAAAEDDPLLDGVRLARSELGAALARVGVESFSPLGERFDPSLHEAMATTERHSNGADCGTVVEVYQPGYRLGASIIRPARVVVAA
jgi:molecular chaperone GrpE